MGTELLLDIRLNPQTLTTITLNDVNLKTKVEDLKCEVAGRANLSKESFELVYCGCILEDDTTLESCGLKNGSKVHVLKKKEPDQPKQSQDASKDEKNLSRLASAFRSFTENPALRNALHTLSKKPDAIDSIIAIYRELYEDSVAIAMLRDPVLMAHITDADTLRRFAEMHPLFVEAALYIAAVVCEEADAMAPNSQRTAYSYSFDNLSDDEEMAEDSSQSSDSTQPSNLPANSSNSTINTAQLAAAFSRAGARFPLATSPSSTSASGTNSGVITTEMFNQAMQQAFATASASVVDPTLPPILPPVLPQSADLQRQLAQMHEMGLQDDAVNVQALQFTNGDVQAAIELVFSGFNDN